MGIYRDVYQIEKAMLPAEISRDLFFEWQVHTRHDNVSVVKETTNNEI